jgi:hypothetical protein
MFIHPKTQAENKDAFADAIRNLRFGGIAVNCWAALNYAIVCIFPSHCRLPRSLAVLASQPAMPWGAYPGHTRENVMSGIGVVHNASFLDFPQVGIGSLSRFAHPLILYGRTCRRLSHMPRGAFSRSRRGL